MRKILRRVFKCIVVVLAIPILYLVIALILSAITIEKKDQATVCDHTIFINTKGVHIDVILPRKDLSPALFADLTHRHDDHYFSFGWGDENFYLNTPTWGDLTFSTAMKAMFLNSPTLMHVIRFNVEQNDWLAIKINATELEDLNNYILASFNTDETGKKQRLPNSGYTEFDNFYQAKGNYSCFKTCNSWTNSALKESGLKSCLWTPFSFGVVGKYQ